MKSLNLILLFSLLFSSPVFANWDECRRLLTENSVSLFGELASVPRIYSRTAFRLSETSFESAQALPIRTAVFESGEYRPEFEARLREEGFLGVTIRNPTEAEIIENPDFILAPLMVRWVMRTPENIDTWLSAMSSSARNQMKRKIKASQSAIHTEFRPLTLADYQLWHSELFIKEIATKKGAIMGVWVPMEAFAQRFGVSTSDLSNRIPNFHRLFMYNEQGELVGGTLISEKQEDSSITVRAAAFEKEHRAKFELAIRGISELISIANAMGYSWMSYGTDPNIYGVDATIGLQRFKASIGMTPVPEANMPVGRLFSLVKYFGQNFEQLRDTEASPEVFTFGVTPSLHLNVRLNAFRQNLSYASQLPDLQTQLDFYKAHISLVQFYDSESPTSVNTPRDVSLAPVRSR